MQAHKHTHTQTQNRAAVHFVSGGNARFELSLDEHEENVAQSTSTAAQQNEKKKSESNNIIMRTLAKLSVCVCVFLFGQQRAIN